MRALLLIGTILSAITLSSQADASYRHLRRHHYQHQFGHYLTARHLHYAHHYRHTHSAARGDLPCCFWEAKRKGGPCGCWAAKMLLGIEAHVWRGVNLWLAADWPKFPHVAPAPGTAAVFYSHGHAYHVAPVIAVHGGTVTLHDSWKIHNVSVAGLVFVQPPVPPQGRRSGVGYGHAVPL
jgi:hypothetical protein